MGMNGAVIGHWCFDENRGETVKDCGRNNYYGMIHGARWVRGKAGFALSFDGKDDYLEIPHPGILTGAKEFTIRFWFKPRVDFDTGICSPKFQFVSKGFGFGISYDRRAWININVKNDSGGQLCYMNILRCYEKDVWYYLAYIYDGFHNHFYDSFVHEDGPFFMSKPGEGTIKGSCDSLYIGMSPDHNNHVCGAIDDVLILNRALSIKEIEEDYEQFHKSGWGRW